MEEYGKIENKINPFPFDSIEWHPTTTKGSIWQGNESRVLLDYSGIIITANVGVGMYTTVLEQRKEM